MGASEVSAGGTGRLARMGGKASDLPETVASGTRHSKASRAPVTVQAEATSAVDLGAISDEEIERLLGRESVSEETEAIEDAKR